MCARPQDQIRTLTGLPGIDDPDVGTNSSEAARLNNVALACPTQASHAEAFSSAAFAKPKLRHC